MRGEMNIVGPRPERPTIFAELREHIAEYPLRQRAKPGITGLAQIHHHYDRSVDDVRTKVRYDLEYIRRRSLGEDIRIMLQTIPVSLSPPRRLVSFAPSVGVPGVIAVVPWPYPCDPPPPGFRPGPVAWAQIIDTPLVGLQGLGGRERNADCW